MEKGRTLWEGSILRVIKINKEIILSKCAPILRSMTTTSYIPLHYAHDILIEQGTLPINFFLHYGGKMEGLSNHVSQCILSIIWEFQRSSGVCGNRWRHILTEKGGAREVNGEHIKLPRNNIQ